MKKSILIILLFISATILFAQMTADEIVQKMDANERVQSSESSGKQIITTSSGQKRTLSMKIYSANNNEKQLTIYTAPSRVKGDKILMLNNGDDIWFYTPKTGRVRHLASHAKRRKVQGSDFTYEDMSTGDYGQDYTARLLGEEKMKGQNCFQLEMIPTESGPHYSKIIVWVDSERFVALQIDYYDEDGEYLKRLDVSDIEQIEGKWIPKKMVMKNVQDGGETIIETTEIQLNVNLDDALFTTRNLKRK